MTPKKKEEMPERVDDPIDLESEGLVAVKAEWIPFDYHDDIFLRAAFII